MSFFGLFTKQSMDEGVAEFRSTPGAILLDVRTSAEYEDGHVEGSRNIPLDIISIVLTEIPDKSTPLFVHCRSGGRSGQAVSRLKQLGYQNVKNIGGILDYSGNLRR